MARTPDVLWSSSGTTAKTREQNKARTTKNPTRKRIVVQSHMGSRKHITTPGRGCAWGGNVCPTKTKFVTYRVRLRLCDTVYLEGGFEQTLYDTFFSLLPPPSSPSRPPSRFLSYNLRRSIVYLISAHVVVGWRTLADGKSYAPSVWIM